MNHIWAIEVRDDDDGWRFIAYRRTRAIARNAQRFSYGHLKTRIRKYVPA